MVSNLGVVRLGLSALDFIHNLGGHWGSGPGVEGCRGVWG